MGSHRNLDGVLVKYRPEVLTVRTECMEVDTKKKKEKKTEGQYCPSTVPSIIG